MTIIERRGSATEFGRRQCVIRIGDFSVRGSWRAVVVVLSLLVGASACAVTAVGIGTYPVAPAEVLGVLLGTNTSFDRVVVLE